MERRFRLWEDAKSTRDETDINVKQIWVYKRSALMKYHINFLGKRLKRTHLFLAIH